MTTAKNEVLFEYNIRVVSRANYFWKTSGHPKSKKPKCEHQIFKIIK